MNIVGLLVSTFPEHSSHVAAQIPKLGAQVHLSSAQGQLVVTIEEEDDDKMTQCITQIQSLKGVLNTALVYHQVDNDLFTEQEHSA